MFSFFPQIFPKNKENSAFQFSRLFIVSQVEVFRISDAFPLPFNHSGHPWLDLIPWAPKANGGYRLQPSLQVQSTEPHLTLILGLHWLCGTLDWAGFSRKLHARTGAFRFASPKMPRYCVFGTGLNQNLKQIWHDAHANERHFLLIVPRVLDEPCQLYSFAWESLAHQPKSDDSRGEWSLQKRQQQPQPFESKLVRQVLDIT